MGRLALCSPARGRLCPPAGSLRCGSAFYCIQMACCESSLTFMHGRRTARPVCLSAQASRALEASGEAGWAGQGLWGDTSWGR